jgi:hypothetical protein
MSRRAGFSEARSGGALSAVEAKAGKAALIDFRK